MKEKNVLKISDAPIITSNGILSFFCTLASSHPSFERWLFSNYLLLTFVNGASVEGKIESQLNFFAPDISACELLECIKVKHEDEDAGVLFDKIIGMLERNFYCILEVNERFIYNTNACIKNYDRTHGVLVYGYDTEERTVCAVAYGKYGKPEQVKVSFDKFEAALSSARPVNPHRFFKLRDNYFGYGWAKIISSFLFYTGVHESVLDEKSGIVVSTGFRATERLIDYILTDTPPYIDIRLFALLKDHKKVILRAIESYSSAGVEFDERIADTLKDNLRNAELIEKLCMKYNFTNRESILPQMESRLRQIIDSEKTVFPMIADSVACYIIEYVA